MATRASLLGKPRFAAAEEASVRHLPWVSLLTSLEGFHGGAPSVVRVLGLWVQSVLSSLSLWLASFGRTFDSLSQTQVSVGKLVPLYGSDLISLHRGWSWGKKIHSLSCQTCRICQPIASPYASWIFSPGALSLLGQPAKRCLAGLCPDSHC